MATPSEPVAVVSFTLGAAAHMLRTVECANKAVRLLREIEPLLDNGTILFANKDLPAKVKAVIAEATEIDKDRT